MPDASAAERSLLAENTAMGERLQRLAPVVAGLARDLAGARREAAALRRKNARPVEGVWRSAGEPASPDAVLFLLAGCAATAIETARAQQTGSQHEAR